MAGELDQIAKAVACLQAVARNSENPTRVMELIELSHAYALIAIAVELRVVNKELESIAIYLSPEYQTARE